MPKIINPRACIALCSIVSTLSLGVTAFAQNNFNNNSAFGTVNGSPVITNWATAARWSLGVVPAATQGDINLTNVFNVVTTITNASGTGLNFLRIISGNAGSSTANSNVTVITSGNLSTDFGFQIGSNAVLVIGNTASFGNNGNSSFDLGRNAAKGLGTLIISNGAGVFLNFNAAIRNDGTILFVSSAGQNSQINYGQNNGATFTNNTGGTIIKLAGSGTGSFIGEFGGSNKAFLNQGTIAVQSGTFRMDPRDAFNNGGFRNTGFIQIDTNTTFEVRRTTNAWENATASMPTNTGTIFMNGGDLRTLDQDGATPGTNTARVIVNAAGGIIRGNGLLDFRIRNEVNTAILEARDGTLSCVASVNNNGSWISTNYGGSASTLNFVLNNFDLGGGILLNSNGTVRLTSGANLTISTAYRQNWGTINFAGAGNLFVPNSASAGSLTNEWVIKKSAAGNAFIITGYGTGGPPNYGFFNRGTLDISSGGRLTINTSNSYSQTFQNLATGTMLIGGNTTGRIARTSEAWINGIRPQNLGTITLDGGVLEVADDTGVTTTRQLENHGVIQGTGVVATAIVSLGGTISPGFSIGRLDVAGDTFISNTTVAVELGALTGQNDLLAFGGSLIINSNCALNISGGTVGNVYTVMTFSARSGTFETNTTGYTVNYGSTVIWIAPVPLTSTITATAGSNGAIAPSGAVVVTNGNDQSFVITPDTCYHVADVLVDAVSVGAVNNYTFTNVTAAHTIDASFAIDSYTITASAGPNGSITPSGAVGVNCGNDQGFTVTPNTGYHVNDVLVDAVSVGPVSSYTFTNVTANHTISASFAIDTFTITASAGANGSIAPSGPVVVNYGDDQLFTITPDTCYHVADVLVDASSIGPVTSFTFTNVTANHTISADFAIDTYSITASAGANGSVAPAGVVTVDCGTNQTFVLTEDPGYPMVDVLVDSISVGPLSSYTFSNVTANHTITAAFATNQFQVLSISRSVNDVDLGWNVAGSHDYIVQSTPGVNGSYSNNFTDLSAIITIPGIGESTTNYVDVGGATNSPARYYRIRLLPLP